MTTGKRLFRTTSETTDSTSDCSSSTLPNGVVLEGKLNFEGKSYELDSLSKETKDLVRGLQVADTQMKINQLMDDPKGNKKRIPSTKGSL